MQHAFPKQQVIEGIDERRSGRGRRRGRLARFGQYVLLVAVAVVMIAPLVWMVLSSVKPDREIIAYPPTILPEEVTVQAYRNLFRVADFGVYLRNSLVVSVLTTAATLAAGLTAAYALSRFRFRYLRPLEELSLFAYMVPPILLLVPIARIVGNLNLANNLAALVLLYTATLLPFALWVLRSYVNGISLDLEHAAMVDGATRFQAFRHVVVPQAIPGVISTGVFTFNAAWSEYLFASTLLTSPDKRTLSPGLTLLFDQTGVYSWAILMAACVLMVVPVIVLFTIVQRQFVGGLGEGALKE